MKKRILVVGGAGYVGGHLVDLLQEDCVPGILPKKYDVTVYDNLLYEDSYYKKVKLIKDDVRNISKLGKDLNTYDIVIWLAAIVGDGACDVNAKVTNEVNKDSLSWLVDNYNGKIIYTSTCSVYGEGDDVLVEESEPKPLSLYAETKLDSERYVVGKQVDHLVFRLGTLHGVGDLFTRLRLDLVANVLTYRACTGQSLKVFGGEQWRPLLHVKDVARAIRYGIKHDLNGLYNLVDRNYQIKEIAEEIKKIIPSTEIVYEDMPFEDQRNYRASGNKYYKNGFRTKYSLTDGIMDIKNVFDENRVKDPQNPIYYNVNYLKDLYERGEFN